MNSHSVLPIHADIVVVGAGPVGATFAQMMAGSHYRVVVVEASDHITTDPRTLGLSFASYTLLNEAGLWQAERLRACPIVNLHVSQQGSLGRVHLAASDFALPALGYALPYTDLLSALRCQLQNAALTFVSGTQVRTLTALPGYAVLELADHTRSYTMTADLVVLAEGGGLGQCKGIKRSTHPYHESAIVTSLSLRGQDLTTAYERFTEDGVLAVLPRYDQKRALIWVLPHSRAESMAAVPDPIFLARVEQALARLPGSAQMLGPRRLWPLSRQQVSSTVWRKIVLIGNAAQTVHPVAAQGLNLGLRDAQRLATFLKQTPRAALSEPGVLEPYAALQRKDSRRVIGLTEGLRSLFAQHSKVPKPLRSAGLFLFNCFPPAHGWLN